jgi:hypothetical protein
MAQVITRCRLTGHYMFMGMDVDPKEFPRSPGPFAVRGRQACLSTSHSASERHQHG